jgi:hypothetical protein
MAQTVKIKRSNTAATTPSLVYGELGWNSADSKLYVGSFANTSVLVSSSATGTVSTVSVVTANGVSGSVATATTTPAITVTLGAITPSSVSTGVVTHSAGTALLPSVTTTGDTNTGIWFPAADTVGLSTGGVERVRVDSAGNVGLGKRVGYSATPTAAYLTTQANAGLTVLHAATDGTDAYQPKRHISAYTANTSSSQYGIMRIRVPTLGAAGFRFTIKHSSTTVPTYARLWEINCADYYSANYTFGTSSISVEGTTDFSRIRLMENTAETIWNSLPTRYLILGQIIAGIGTVSNTAGSQAVSGSGTKFTHLFKVGDGILINGLWRYVSAIASDTALTVLTTLPDANSAVAYSRGDAWHNSHITIDSDQLHAGSGVQMNTAFEIDFADTEATLSLVAGIGRDITINNTNAQHGFVGIGTQSPSNLLHVSQQKLGRGTVSNSASGAASSTVLSGVNTTFLDTFKVGDSVTVPHIGGSTGTPQTVVVLAIASNTSMTVAAITNANSGVNYSLVGGTLFSVAGNGTITTSSGNTLSGTNTGDQTAASLGLVIGTNVQAYDAKLTTLAGLAVTDNAVIIGNGTSFVVESGATLKTSLGLTIGTNVQAYNYRLMDYIALVHTPGGMMVSDGDDWALKTTAQVRTNLSLTVGTDVQAYKAGLQSLGNISTTGADRVIYATATNVYTTSAFTAFGRSLVDDADAATARTTLGLGTLATQTGTFSGTSSGTNTGDQTLAGLGVNIQAGIPGGRLTLLSGSGFTNTDQIAKAIIYYTPYLHNSIALWDVTNSKWVNYTFTEKSISIAGYTWNNGLSVGTGFDVFASLFGGAVILSTVEWTGASGLARSSAIAYQDGVPVLSADRTKRYLGTFITTAVGQTTDREFYRYLYNYYNKKQKILRTSIAANHAYATATIRAYNGGVLAAGFDKCSYVNGLEEQVIGWTISATIQSMKITGGTSALAANGMTELFNPSTTAYTSGSVSGTLILLEGPGSVYVLETGVGASSNAQKLVSEGLIWC